MTRELLFHANGTILFSEKHSCQKNSEEEKKNLTKQELLASEHKF